jgi:hypothetical protein
MQSGNEKFQFLDAKTVTSYEGHDYYDYDYAASVSAYDDI